MTDEKTGRRKRKWTVANVSREQHKRITNIVKHLERKTGRTHTIGEFLWSAIERELRKEEKRLNGGKPLPAHQWDPADRIGRVTERERVLLP